jgi:hypothetical protein
MTSDVEGHSDGHGPIFVVLFIKLNQTVFVVLRLDPDSLLESAEADGVAVASGANPTFVDAELPAGNGHAQTPVSRIQRAFETKQV